MATQLTYLGHASWLIKTDDHTIVLDPFLTENPKASASAADITADFVLVSHGHFDHVADVAEIANKNDAQVLAVYEIAQWFQEKHQVKNVIGMNTGGGIQLPFGHVKLTPALHSSALPDGTYGGMPVGFVLSLPEGRIYFACDTALFSDMSLVGETGVDLAVLPIGDHFTMGPEDAVRATKLIKPKRVVPNHYNTFPPIEQDADAWAEQIRSETAAEPVVLQPGESTTL